MRLQEYIDTLARDCIHYSDSRPCPKHLQSGQTCKCSSYQPRTGKALFIQLSSPETVLRSNALLHRIRQEQPGLHMSYMTRWPDLLGPWVHETIYPDGGGFARIQCEPFDLACNLDPHREACSLMNLIQAERRHGVTLVKGHPQPLESAAGFFADQMLPARQQHPRHLIPLRQHLQDLFSLCQLEYNREMPRLDLPADPIANLADPGTPIGLIHLNDRWPFTSRQWTAILDQIDGTVILTGDENSDLLNRHIAHHTHSIYPGPVSMKTWLHYAATADLVIAPAGWQAEAAWALGKQVIVVQMSRRDRLYLPDDFPARMMQIPYDQLTPEHLSAVTLESLLTYSFSPDDILSSMFYPKKHTETSP